MKILIISGEVWRDDTNGGNVLTNMFSDFNAEFAQIYCNPGTPNNQICKRYYQMTDRMVINNVFKRKVIGKQFEYDSTDVVECESGAEQPNKKFYSFFHKHRLGVFYSIKGILWNISKWKNDNLSDFVIGFQPDVIFAPCYGNTFMLKLTRHIYSLIKKPIVSYISDDSYSLRQISFSLFYWINRFSVRKQLRKTFPCYSLVYTMTDAQKEQCEKVFSAKTKILRKSIDITNIPINYIQHSPIRIIYAGGIYLNRWKSLSKLADGIEQINDRSDKRLFELDIYTGDEVGKRIKKALSKESCAVHKKISSNELTNIYNEYDIALHVESFDVKNRLAVRMSFSTKITDCLGSGCAVMAICDEKQGGLQYLKNNDAAICITDLKDIKDVLEQIVDNQNILNTYAQKAKECCIRNHDSMIIKKGIYDDFVSISGAQ